MLISNHLPLFRSGIDAIKWAVRVAELGAGVLPDAADTSARVKVYESLYGVARCARGFVAMRLEWPNEASMATKSESPRTRTDARASHTH